MRVFRPLWIVLFLSAPVSAAAEQAERNLVIPREFHRIAQEHDCDQIDKFYHRHNRGPAHILGAMPRTGKRIAVFWCQRAPGENVLMFAADGEYGLEYAGEIANTHTSANGLSFIPAREAKLDSGGAVIVLPDSNGRQPKGREYEGLVIQNGGIEGSIFFYREGAWYQLADW